jgi:restriction endonuclease S subunit
MAVHTGDIIVSLTRPHHGSIAQITPELDGCVTSTGFSVIRGVDESRVMNDYLWCILRRKICLSQMLQRASGGNYPAITEPELAKVLIPVPAMDIQETIAAEARRRRDEARRLRAEADSGWQAAKHWFEEQLLGPVQP